MNWIKQHKLIFIVAIVVLAVALWYGLSQSNAPAPLLTTDAPSGVTLTDPADQQLVGTLLALRAVTLNGSIFTEASFLSLQDFSTTIVPEPVGRDNPFAPLRPSVQILPAVTHEAQLFTPKK